MPRVKSRFETFGDGLLTICEAEERSLIRTKMEHIRYGSRTAGIERFWKAKTAGNEVSQLLSVPMSVLEIGHIDTQDIVILEKESGQYQILQVQPKFDAQPPVLYLSLEKLVHPYKDGRKNIGGQDRKAGE